MFPSLMPIWMQPVSPEGWPTRRVSSQTLHYSLPVPINWSNSPVETREPTTRTHVFRGFQLEEWLVISFMGKANPDSDMLNWVNGIVNILGFPLEQVLNETSQTPQLIEWQSIGASKAIAKSFGLDEIHLYTGMGRWTLPRPSYSRLYQVLARRGGMAWKVSLMFASACPPGMPEDLVTSNDHIRAGAILGQLRFP